MLTPRYYHVTERTDAAMILEEGFQGGWGDVGFGIYTYGSHQEAVRYAAKGGWDNRLQDPVILVLEDHGLEKVEPEPGWNPAHYEQMYWKPMDEDDEEAFWKPQGMALLEVPSVVPEVSSAPRVRMRR